jgi:CelD/BcsL family acetyltransferase involved in cellulose biosynthesis
MPRTAQEILDQADELADQFEQSEAVGRRRPDTPEIALRRAAYHRAMAEREVLRAVAVPRRDAELLMIGTVPGEAVVTVPLALSKSGDPRKARPLGIYRSSAEERALLRDGATVSTKGVIT